ncbi:spherulin 4-like cell surface protein [Aspergillus nomiae NRRL 13137]|uniref:Spherulin 4-like cell surface protein n=1 Tax=Aspergillus nomiae NRRL (strain ATCC 15546 / NRRL 13137 / CBS 260.88 / M93) TaxID=1509407 RepID=A0A0L1JHQ7_ASPN3|nr:spherulin 4-like cell surface protein [Aspergillus nomiae NRRL 13137]KNG91237.1 spherulin 4-like cell surface protein [Aspergillus nomiae NRRL 13137]
MLSVNILRVLSCLLLLFQVVQTAIIPIRQYDSEEQDDATNDDTNSQGSKPSHSLMAPSASATTTTPLQSGGNLAGGTEIIIPYYVYPEDGAWTPVEQLAANNPNVKFTIIINPSNGPGGDRLPDANWRKAIPKLRAHPNIAVIGYVATGYGGRALSAVKRDITTYANWPTLSGDASFAVHGIFLDEAAAELDDKKVAFYKQLTTKVKENKGFGPHNNVVMNPGTVPDNAYLEIPDSTVIFESPHREFQEAMAGHEFDRVKNIDKARLSSMVTSVPTGTDLAGLVGQLREITGHIYLSNSASYLEYPQALDVAARIIGSS